MEIVVEYLKMRNAEKSLFKIIKASVTTGTILSI